MTVNIGENLLNKSFLELEEKSLLVYLCGQMWT